MFPARKAMAAAMGRAPGNPQEVHRRQGLGNRAKRAGRRGVSRAAGVVPTPPAGSEAANRDTVYVRRIREDISHERVLNLWILSVNIRKAAATNSIQNAEILVREHI
jgi:aspartate-semialdehyde dehydrogenase